jgi:hypothetical protein
MKKSDISGPNLPPGTNTRSVGSCDQYGEVPSRLFSLKFFSPENIYTTLVGPGLAADTLGCCVEVEGGRAVVLESRVRAVTMPSSSERVARVAPPGRG